HARDAAGNVTAAPSVNVTLDNAVVRSPIAAWAFDESNGSVAIDATGHGHNGSIVGALRTAGGHSGGALSFDGNDDVVNVPDAPALDLSGAMTLAAWIRPDSIPITWSAIMQKAPSIYFLDASSNIGRPAAGFTSVSTGCCSDAFGPAPLTPGVWTHLAASYDGAQVRLYIDGAHVGSGAAGGARAGHQRSA